MKSVGIMSMQRILNYGSSLQAYALKRMIESLDSGARVSFLDFEPGQPLIAADNAEGGSRSRIARSLAKLREYNAVDARVADKLRFFNHKRTYAARYFPMIGIPLAPNRDFAVDLQVIGSDEVFNCVQSNSNVGYSRDLFGHRSPARRLVSYAASFGNTTLAKLDAAGVRTELEEDLARFTTISVRDRNSADIVEALTGRRPQIHVDPVLAYDYLGQEARIPQGRLVEDKYILVYGYAGRLGPAENRELRRHADGIGAKVLTIGGIQTSADRFIDCNPFDVLGYFRDAEAVVTDTFHGTIFSIINDVPFATIIRPSVADGYGNEEKLAFLLETFGLEDRRLGDAGMLAQLLRRPLDSEAVSQVLDRVRREALGYLGEVINAE